MALEIYPSYNLVEFDERYATYPPPTSLSDFSAVVMKHVEKFYEQLNNIIIDDNHSFLMANIAIDFATTSALPILKILVRIND